MGEFGGLLRRQKEFFGSGATYPAAFRKQQLDKLYDAVRNAEAEVTEALAKDFAKPPMETYLTEVGFLLAEIRHAAKHVRRWARPRKVPGTMALIGSRSWIMPEPYGSALIIAPWNYPFQLALGPLIGAIAAGNCAVVKPSELTPHTSAVIARILRQVFRGEYVAVVEGGVETSKALLADPFDLIFFTGSTAVGRIVAEAAARHLTPTILELGGKSPAIVHDDAKLDLAARRIVWGKFLNAGQTCVAPDYLLVHRRIKEPLVRELKRAITDMYGDVLADSRHYPSIIHERHFQRLSAFLGDGTVVHGGRTDALRRLIEPTLLTDTGWESPVMQEEIFGPVLPILEYGDLDEAVRLIRARPKPLALYLFTENRETERRVMEQLPFGGGCINDTVMHLTSPHLPFGGVGPSGTGAYHGKFGFDAFSHEKGILKQTTRFDMKLRYDKSGKALRLIRKLLR